MDVPTVLIARTDANSAKLITSDVDERDRPFLTGERTPEGFFRSDRRPARPPSPAASPTPPTPTCSGARPPSPISTEARQFAEAIHAEVPGQAAGLQLLAVVQLEGKARRRHDRHVPARAGRDGLQVPVHHAGRLPRAQPVDVRAGPGLPETRHDRLLASSSSASSPARPRRLSRRQAPALRRHRLLRPGGPVRRRRRASTTALHGSTEEEQFAAAKAS